MQDSSYDWDYLAGIEEAKQQIEDTILLTLGRPDISDKITQVTRVRFEKKKQTEGGTVRRTPGTGKTTSARIISHQIKAPLVYIRLESIFSKYYGEAESNLGKVLENCISLGKCMILLIKSTESREGNA